MSTLLLLSSTRRGRTLLRRWASKDRDIQAEQHKCVREEDEGGVAGQCSSQKGRVQ